MRDDQDDAGCGEESDEQRVGNIRDLSSHSNDGKNHRDYAGKHPRGESGREPVLGGHRSQY